MDVHRKLGVVLLSAMVLSGCAAQRHIIQPTPTLEQDLSTLEADLDLLPPFPYARKGSGSLWTDAGIGAALTRDHRAYRVNDLLTIVVAESSSGRNSASTDISRETSTDFAAPFVFGLDNLDEVLTVDSGHSHQGDGQTNRSSNLASTITARVMRVLPNGAMMIAGQKTVMVNREREVLTLVGVVRPEDVTSGNRVPSSVISDLTVRLWGAGELNDTIRQGWFMRIMNKIWPF